MKYLFIIYILLLTQITFAQSPPHIQDAKRCNNWGMGYGGNSNPAFITRTSLKIIPFQQKARSTQVDFWETNSHISDTLGNLLFYTNGIMIADTTHHNMMGSDTLNPGYWASNWIDGYRLSQGTLILPFPNQPNLYYVFHTRTPNNTAYSLAEGIYYTIVDMNGNNGLGEVVSLRNPIIQNSVFSPRITACRHANGRDWWILIRSLNTDAYATMLLSPQGVSSPVWHTALLPQNNYTASSFYSQSCFSPDGTKFVYYTALSDPGSYITLYDFDRCSGTISNPRFSMVNDSTSTVGVAFSENSKYLYFNTYIRLFQVDVTNNTPFSHIDTIGVYDGFQDSVGFVQLNTYFSTSQLGDDGRIYIRCSGANRYMHTINNPNLNGLSASFQQHSVKLLTFNGTSISLSPYFALGPIDGSPCDTLGIDNVATQESPPLGYLGSISVFPNPTNGIINIQTNTTTPLQYKLYDILGRETQSGEISTLREGQGAVFQISLQQLNNGIYFLHFTDKSGKAYRATKVVVQHE